MLAATCPRCGYDLAGLAATWTDRCPLETTCSECGTTSPSRSLFQREALGPPWSLEHASRRFIRKWFATTLTAVRPSPLWTGYRPEHPIFARRLVFMGVIWLLSLHLLCATMLGLSWLGLSAAGSASVNPWASWQLREWWFWRPLLTRLLWPYPGMIEIPVTTNTTFANPVYGFVMMASMPTTFMGLFAWLWLRRPREGRLPARHLLRALALSIPHFLLWTIISALTISLFSRLETPTHSSPISAVLMFTLLGGYLLYITWWWRCFVVHYAGKARRQWVLVPLGVGALILGWGSAIVISELLHL